MCTLIFMSPMMAQDGTWALTTFMFVRVAMTPQHCQMGYVFVYSVRWHIRCYSCAGGF